MWFGATCIGCNVLARLLARRMVMKRCPGHVGVIAWAAVQPLERAYFVASWHRVDGLHR